MASKIQVWKPIEIAAAPHYEPWLLCITIKRTDITLVVENEIKVKSLAKKKLGQLCSVCLDCLVCRHNNGWRIKYI